VPPTGASLSGQVRFKWRRRLFDLPAARWPGGQMNLPPRARQRVQADGCTSVRLIDSRGWSFGALAVGARSRTPSGYGPDYQHQPSRPKKASAPARRVECRANTSGILLPFAVSFYRFEFMPIAQPARYITTAHSPLCRETMSLRGRGKDGSASGACEVPARHEPLGGSGHDETRTEFQIER
jgi:hypothetical protein